MADGPKNTNRAGRLIQQREGYRAFIPNPLPPDPPLIFDNAMIGFLSKADRALGRPDGITPILPNPDLFVAMSVRKEAVLSSQIERTQRRLAKIDCPFGLRIDWESPLI